VVLVGVACCFSVELRSCLLLLGGVAELLVADIARCLLLLCFFCCVLFSLAAFVLTELLVAGVAGSWRTVLLVAGKVFHGFSSQIANVLPAPRFALAQWDYLTDTVGRALVRRIEKSCGCLATRPCSKVAPSMFDASTKRNESLASRGPSRLNPHQATHLEAHSPPGTLYSGLYVPTMGLFQTYISVGPID
jgi:hypothetical protein